MPANSRKPVPWSLSLRLTLRDLRSGEVAVLLAALTIAVAAMSAVNFFTDRVRQAVARQAGEALAADLRLESSAPLDRSILSDAAAAGLDVAELVHFNSVILAGEQTALVDIRGVSSAYPLRGEMRIASSLGGRPEPASGIPQAGEAWLEPALLARLGLDVGDSVEIGTLSLTVSGTLEFRPDEGWRLMEIAPTVLVNLDDIAGSGLLAPGSIAEYEFLFAGAQADVDVFRTRLEAQMTPGLELRDARDGRPEVRGAIESAERFLMLAAMISVLLGGVAVAIAARRYVARRLDSVALMKCIGAQHRDILRLNLLQLLVLVAAASVIGCAAGYLAQYGLIALLGDLIEVDLPQTGLARIWLGPLTALVVATGFALPPLLSLGRVPTMRVLRKDLEPIRPGLLVIYGIAAFSLGALLYALFADLELIGWVLGGSVATLGLLYLAGSVLVRLLQRLRGQVGIAWRYGIANVARRGAESSVQVMAFGLGLMILLLLGLLRTELMTEWQDLLPEAAANQFMINIQPGEPEAIAATLTEGGLPAPDFTPLLRARISEINGVPLADHQASPWARRELEDELNLTWLAELTDDNRVIDGDWWQPGDTEPQLSIEQSLAQRTGLKLGDSVGFNVGGETIIVTITSIRSVTWESFRPNFFLVVNPGVAEQYAHTYLASLYVPPDSRSTMLEVARRFPAVSVIDIDAVLDQVRNAMRQATLAVQYVFLFTLAAGVMVLLAAIQASREERVYESAILRTLGARRRTVLAGLAAEFLSLGALAGLIGGIGAGTLVYFMATRLFELDYVPGPGVLITGLVAGSCIVGITGTLALRNVVATSPGISLRRA